MQMTIGTVLITPYLAEMPDHVAYAGLGTMVAVVVTQKADDLPNVRRPTSSLRDRPAPGRSPRSNRRDPPGSPRCRSEHRAPDLDHLRGHPRVGVAARRKDAWRPGRIVRRLSCRPELERDLAVEPAMEPLDARHQHLAATRRQVELRPARTIHQDRSNRFGASIHLQNHRVRFNG